jgi:coronatine-insensitive protein 1
VHISYLPEAVLGHIFGFITAASDRSSISLVCRDWYSVDRKTRKFITIASCYSIVPSRLTRRFEALSGVKIKGKPRATMFQLCPNDWGGHASPWISEISANCSCLVSVHLRRMIVTDDDLAILASRPGNLLQVLKLEKCSGFSTFGLQAIARFCR